MSESRSKPILRIQRYGRAIVYGAAFCTCGVAAANADCETPLGASAVHYEYDALGRLHQVCYGKGHIITYAYDANGNRVSVETTDETGAPPDPGQGGGVGGFVIVPLNGGFSLISVGLSGG